MNCKPDPKLRITWWPVGFIAMLVAIPLLLYAWAIISVDYAASVAFGPNALPVSMPHPDQWPTAVQELHKALTAANEIAFDGYLLYGAPGEFTVKNAIFRIDATGLDWQRVVDLLNLVAVSGNHKYVAGWGDKIVSKASEEWWVDNDSDVEHYVNQPMLQGEEGDLYIAAYDNTKRQIFIVYQFNF